MACYISTTEAANNFPLTWSRGGSTLTASDEQTLTVAGTATYTAFYTLTVAASDNLVVFTCTATLPSGTTSATWTVYVLSESPSKMNPIQPIQTSLCYSQVYIHYMLYA